MLIQNIKLIDYNQQREKLTLIVSSNKEAIKQELNNQSELSIYTDNLSEKDLVETLNGYSTILSIEELSDSGQFEVQIVKEDSLELQLLAEKQRVEELKKEQYSTLESVVDVDFRLTMLELGI